MAEDRLSFPNFKQGGHHRTENPVPPFVKPYYHKYGGREAIAIGLEEGGIGGKWEVFKLNSKVMEFIFFQIRLIYIYI